MQSKAASTHASLCFILKFAQCFGLLPVCGITNEDSTFLKFKWTSKRALFSVSFCSIAFLNILFHLFKMVRIEQIPFYEYVTLEFFTVSAVTVAIFIDIARKWPNLIKTWTDVDTAMASYGFPSGLHQRLKIVAIVVMTAAFVEHFLFLASVSKYAQRGDSVMETLRLHFEDSFQHVFTVVPYHITLGLILQLVNILSTVSWNFMDLFIMLISLSLSARFKQVVMSVNKLVKHEEENKDKWQDIREDYTRLIRLSRTVDDVVSTVLLVSFGNNLVTIVVQLFYSLQDPVTNGVLDKFYHVFSFMFLVIRTATVALCAATIDSESKKPQYYLNNLTYIYNEEIERFVYQVEYDTAALTGHKLFKLTKPLILKIARAVVSYELILIQFSTV